MKRIQKLLKQLKTRQNLKITELSPKMKNLLQMVIKSSKRNITGLDK